MPAVTLLGPRREAACFLYEGSAATAPAPSLLEPAG
jgi:hypothetical protein